MGQIYSLTSAEAEKIMAAAMQTLKNQLKVAAVSIVNHDGTEIAKMVMDGIRLFTGIVAFMKANQSAYTGKSTRNTRDEIKAGEKTAEMIGIDPRLLVPWAGGLPIYDEEGHLLGGIGVSNLDQGEDEAVAEIAVHLAGLRTQKQ